MSKRPNMRSSSVKRILQEHKELLEDPPADFTAGPLEEDMFEWHVTVKGAEGTEYEGGIYHLRLSLPPTYPLSPPSILILTPSGRFEPLKKICIDGLTDFHTGSWMPAWGIRTVVVGLMSFWYQTGRDVEGAVGGMSCSKDERRRLARLSPEWTCQTCGSANHQIMKDHLESVETKTVKDAEKKALTAEEKGKGKAVEMAESSVDLPAPAPIIAATQAPPPPPTRITATTVPPTIYQPLPPLAAVIAGPVPPQPQPLNLVLSSLLTPPPTYLPPLRLLHTLLLHLALPRSLHAYLPPPPDRILVVDTAIFFVGTFALLMIFGKAARTWSGVAEGGERFVDWVRWAMGLAPVDWEALWEEVGGWEAERREMGAAGTGAARPGAAGGEGRRGDTNLFAGAGEVYVRGDRGVEL